MLLQHTSSIPTPFHQTVTYPEQPDFKIQFALQYSPRNHLPQSSRKSTFKNQDYVALFKKPVYHQNEISLLLLPLKPPNVIKS